MGKDLSETGWVGDYLAWNIWCGLTSCGLREDLGCVKAEKGWTGLADWPVLRFWKLGEWLAVTLNTDGS